MEEFARQFRKSIQEYSSKKAKVIQDYRVLRYEVDKILEDRANTKYTVEDIINKLEQENIMYLDTIEERATIEMCMRRFEKQVLPMEITR